MTPRTRRVPPRTAVVAAVLAATSLAGCATNINDMLAELEHGDPAAARDVVVEIGEYLRAKELARQDFDAADREALAYLGELARKGPDPTVRATAISNLAAIRSHDGTRTFVEALGDGSAPWVVRLDAAQALTLRPAADAAEPLARALRNEGRVEVVLSIISALRATGGPVAEMALLDAFLDGGPRFESSRLALHDALHDITGKEIPFRDLKAWREYRETRRAAETEAPEAPPASLVP